MSIGFSLNMFKSEGPMLYVNSCNQKVDQSWIWNSDDSTIRNQHNSQCLTLQDEIEVWAGPLNDTSKAVLLFKRGNGGSEPITVKWTDIGLPADKAATVRDIWALKDLGSFTGSYTSPNIEHHSVMMLKITPSK